MTTRRLFMAVQSLISTVGPRIGCYTALGLLLIWGLSERRLHLRARRTGQPLRVPEGADFGALSESRDDPGFGARIHQALLSLESANAGVVEGLFSCVPKDLRIGAVDDPGESDYILREVLGQIVAVDVLGFSGDFDELDIPNVARGIMALGASRNTRDEVLNWAPRDLSELIMELLGPASEDTVYDPACGSGGLLAAADRWLVTQGRSEYSVGPFGQESEPLLRAIAGLVLMLLSNEEFVLEPGSALQEPGYLDDSNSLRKFDVVVSVPPRSLVLGEQWDPSQATEDPFSRFLRGVPPKTHPETAYLLHMVESMALPGGRMAGVFSLGTLFRGGTEQEIRARLVEENLLDAVIALPEKILYETRTPMALLILKQGRTDDSIMFIDASNSYKRDRSHNWLAFEQKQAVLEAYRSRSDIPGYARLVSREEIRANECNLQVPRYVQPITAGCKSVRELTSEHKSLLRDLRSIGTNIDRLALELGQGDSEQ